MLLALTEDQEFFRSTTARYLAEKVPPETLRAMRDDPVGFDWAYWRQGADLGWTSLLVAEERGGGSISDQGLIDLGLLAYEFGRCAAPGPLVGTNGVEGTARRRVHCGLVRWRTRPDRPAGGLGTSTPRRRW